MRPYPIYPLVQAILWLLNEEDARLCVRFRNRQAALSELGSMRFRNAFGEVPSVVTELAALLPLGEDLLPKLTEIRLFLDQEVRRLLSLFNLPATDGIMKNYLTARNEFDRRREMAEQELREHHAQCTSSPCVCLALTHAHSRPFLFLQLSVLDLQEFRQQVQHLSQFDTSAA